MPSNNRDRRNKLSKKLHLYATPHHITAALLRREKFPGKVCEFCCGLGDIADVLKEGGYRKVFCSDLHDWGYPGTVVQDFLRMRKKVGSIVTNPPHNKGRDFVRHAKTLSNKVAMLLPTDFLAAVDASDLRGDAEFPLKAIYTFTQAIRWRNDDRTYGKIKFAWHVWERGYGGNTIQEFITFASKTLEEIPSSNPATANGSSSSGSQRELVRTPLDGSQSGRPLVLRLELPKALSHACSSPWPADRHVQLAINGTQLTPSPHAAHITGEKLIFLYIGILVRMHSTGCEAQCQKQNRCKSA